MIFHEITATQVSGAVVRVLTEVVDNKKKAAITGSFSIHYNVYPRMLICIQTVLSAYSLELFNILSVIGGAVAPHALSAL